MSLVLQPWPRGSAPALNTLHSGHWLTWDGPSGGLGGERPDFSQRICEFWDAGTIC